MIPAWILFLGNGVYLSVLSFLDMKTYNLDEGGIPSLLTTGFSLLMFMLNPNPAVFIAGFLVGLFFIDANLFEGLPDWKAIVSSALVFPTIYHVLIFGGLVAGFGSLYKFIYKRKYKQAKEVPFIPAILAAFLAMGVFL